MDNKIKASMNKVFENCTNTFSVDACLDQVIGICEINNGSFKFKEKWIYRADRKNNANKCKINNRNTNYKNILVILESPHKDEYKDIEFIAPALGKTGMNLDNKFEFKIKEVIANHEELKQLNGEYNLILANAIQYPTSLGFSTSKFRDRIWLDLWIVNNFRQHLINRINDYRPSIIINLCTNGAHKENPFVYDENSKDITKKFLEDIFKNDEKFRVSKSQKKIMYDEKCVYNENLANIRLKMFVQNAIQEYKEKNEGIFCLLGTHPSSWSENDESKFELYKMIDILKLEE